MVAMLKARDVDRVGLADGGHVVYFYEDDEHLVRLVGQYFASGVEGGESVVAIATAAHRKSFLATMCDSGIDVDRAASEGRLVLLDADDTLSRIAPLGRLRASDFEKVVGGIIREAGRGERPVRAYGEMVAVLWDRGDVAGAIELEGLWDELGRQVPFGLFCAYPLAAVGNVDKDEDFDHVCRLHSRVVGGAPLPACADSFHRFVATKTAASLARRYVTTTLEQWHCPEAIDDALIVVSELAANSVQYAGGDFTVGLSRSAGSLRVTVGDPNPDPPKLGNPGLFALGGRGLPMIDRLATAWGQHRAGSGKLVWVDLGGGNGIGGEGGI